MWASHGLTLWLPLYWRLHFHRCLMACMRKASQPLWRITSERTASISSGSVSQRIRTTRRPIRTHLICPLSQSTRAVHEDDEGRIRRSEEHTSELQSLMRTSYAVFCLKKKNNK